MRLATRIDRKTRAAVEAFARRRGLSLSDAVRTLAVLGAGGSETDARALNAEMATARAKAREGLPVPVAYDGRDGAGARRGVLRLEVKLQRARWLKFSPQVEGGPRAGARFKKAVVAGLQRVL